MYEKVRESYVEYAEDQKVLASASKNSSGGSVRVDGHEVDNSTELEKETSAMLYVLSKRFEDLALMVTKNNQ